MLRHLKHLAQNKRHAWIHDLEADLHRLRYLFWETTRRCNLTCLHCGSDCGRDDDQVGLPAEKVLEVFTRIAGEYDAAKIVIVATGGEPLVRRDLADVLGRARQMGFRFGTVTNGWLLSAKRARQLASAGMESVVVSLDGPQPTHDWLRDRGGSRVPT